MRWSPNPFPIVSAVFIVHGSSKNNWNHVSFHCIEELLSDVILAQGVFKWQVKVVISIYNIPTVIFVIFRACVWPQGVDAWPTLSIDINLSRNCATPKLTNTDIMILPKNRCLKFEVLMTYTYVLLQLLYIFFTATFWITIAYKPRYYFRFMLACTGMLDSIWLYLGIQQLSFKRMVFYLFYHAVRGTKVWVFPVGDRPIKEVIPLEAVTKTFILL